MATKNRVDLVSSRVYPGLERDPGPNDNWVEKAGQLPDYIERIAKHLHYEQGFTISHAIATAINTVKRWARGGTVTTHGTTKRVSPKTVALATKALAQWEALKAKELSQELTREQKILLIDLALTKDGRKSYKNQGKWRHGFIPVDRAARVSKAKGSPIAMKRMRRLYGGKKPNDVERSKLSGVKSSKGGSQERVARVAQARRAVVADSAKSQKVVKTDREHSQGGGAVKRSEKPWSEIPEAQKVVRNGKKYVMTIYRGKQQLVEWVGEDVGQKAPDPGKRILKSLRMVDAQAMDTATLRRLLKTPGQPESVRLVLNAALRKKIAEAKK